VPLREHFHRISKVFWESQARMKRLNMQVQEPGFIHLRNSPQGTERQAMQSPPQSSPGCLPKAAEAASPSRKRDDLAYQAVTVAAILLVLCSLWLF